MSEERVIVNQDVPVTIIDVINRRTFKKKSIHAASTFLNIRMDRLIPWFKRSLTHPIKGNVIVKVNQELFDLSWKGTDDVYVYDHVDETMFTCRDGFQLSCRIGVHVNESKNRLNERGHYYRAGYSVCKDKDELMQTLKKVDPMVALTDRHNYYAKERTKDKLDPITTAFKQENKTYTVELYNYETGEVKEFNNLISLAANAKVLKERAERAVTKCLLENESVLLNGYGLRTTLVIVPWKKFNKYKLYCSKNGLALTTGVFEVTSNSEPKLYHKIKELATWFNVNMEVFFLENMKVGTTKLFTRNNVEFKVTRVN